MAQPINCDNTEKHDDPTAPVAAVMMTVRLEDGETFAWCGPCYVDLCVAIARQAEVTPAEGPAPLEATGDDDEDDDEDAAAVERLKVVKRGTSKSRKAFEARKRARPAPAPRVTIVEDDVLPVVAVVGDEGDEGDEVDR